MRKLLLGTTALAAAATLTANAALADVSISASTEWHYIILMLNKIKGIRNA
jgi:hypothetical protein